MEGAGTAGWLVTLPEDSSTEGVGKRIDGVYIRKHLIATVALTL